MLLFTNLTFWKYNFTYYIVYTFFHCGAKVDKAKTYIWKPNKPSVLMRPATETQPSYAGALTHQAASSLLKRKYINLINSNERFNFDHNCSLMRGSTDINLLTNSCFRVDSWGKRVCTAFLWWPLNSVCITFLSLIHPSTHTPTATRLALVFLSCYL